MNAATTTEQYDGVTIYLAPTDPADLFESIPTDYEYDRRASAEKFDALVAEHLERDLPGATVQYSNHDAYQGRVEADDRELADSVYELVFGEGRWVDSAAYAVSNADGGEAWLVLAEDQDA